MDIEAFQRRLIGRLRPLTADRDKAHRKWAFRVHGPYLTPEQWAEFAPANQQPDPLPIDRDQALIRLKECVEQGIDAAVNHSTMGSRRCGFMASELAWLVGMTSLSLMVGNDELWHPFGAPFFAVAASELKIPEPQSGLWMRMREGQPCTSRCDSGCPVVSL
mgnify:CR=1 FL=1